MNPFIINQDDIKYLFDAAGINVLINGFPNKAIITNSGFTSENDERYINTLQLIHMGDMVTFNNEQYIIITEVIAKRHAKYRAIMRHCNFMIEIAGETSWDYLRDENGNIVYDRFGDPVMIEVEGDPVFIPVIIDNKYFQVNNQFPIRVGDNQIVATAQDNELNRNKLKLNDTFELMGRNWKVLHQDLTKRGLLNLTCERA